MTIASSAQPASRATAVGRVHAWDALRVFAMIDVASWHLTGDHWLAGMGLPLFHMLSVALSVMEHPSRERVAFVRGKTRRLLLPWLFWSGLFASIRSAEEWQASRSAWGWLEPSMLLYGPAIALWFLPYAALTSLLADAARRKAHANGLTLAVLPFAFCAGLATLPFAAHLTLGWPFDQWLFSIPSALFGFVIGCAFALGSRERARAALLLGCVGLAAWVLLLRGLDPTSARHVPRFLLAFALIAGALWLPDRREPVSAALCPLLLGVYILHPFLYERLLDPFLWQVGLGRMGWVRLTSGVAVSALAVWLLRRTPLRRFV